MKEWKSISFLVPHMKLVRGSGDLRTDAGKSAIETVGLQGVIEDPLWINIAALALTMNSLTIHQITPGASGIIDETDLHSIPADPPKLLSSSWILESKRPDYPLFDETANLAGYWIDGKIGLLGFNYPDGARFALWTPRWGDGEIALPGDFTPNIDVDPQYYAWAMHAARYVLILAIMLEAEKTPIESDNGGRKSQKRVKGKHGDWTVRRVYLGKTYGRHGEKGTGDHANIEGKMAEVVPVRGHLKRQPYGPGRAERRWVWIEGYEARRWILPGPRKIVVSE